MAIPSNNSFGNSVRITLSLNVPGSPSSALQKTYLSVHGDLEQNSHFKPVGKPAPPRPRRFDCFISSITWAGVIVTAFLIASPGVWGSHKTDPFLRIWFVTTDLTSSELLLPSPKLARYICSTALPAF